MLSNPSYYQLYKPKIISPIFFEKINKSFLAHTPHHNHSHILARVLHRCKIACGLGWIWVEGVFWLVLLFCFSKVVLLFRYRGRCLLLRLVYSRISLRFRWLLIYQKHGARDAWLSFYLNVQPRLLRYYSVSPNFLTIL